MARAVAAPFRDSGVHVIGFGVCYPNAYADRMMKAFCTHPNVGAVRLEGRTTLDELSGEIYQLTLAVANDRHTASEELGHQEFVLTYKTFKPTGPACQPSS